MTDQPAYRDPFPSDYVQRWAIYSLAAYNGATGILDTSVNMVFTHAPPIDNPNEDIGFTLQVHDMLLGFARIAYPPDQGWMGHATTHSFIITSAFEQWAKEQGK